MNRERDDIDDILRSRLRNLTHEVPSFDAMMARKPKRNSKRIALAVMVSSVAASLLMMLAVKDFFITEPDVMTAEVASIVNTNDETVVPIPEPRPETPVMANAETLPTERKSIKTSAKRAIAIAPKNQPLTTQEPTHTQQSPGLFAVPIEEPVAVVEPVIKKNDNKETEVSSFDLDEYARSLEEPLMNLKGTSNKGSGWGLALHTGSQAGVGGEISNSSPYPYSLRSAVVLVNALNPDKKVVEDYKFKHAIPVTVGLSVRKKVYDHLYLESGISYTYLSSVAEKTGTYACNTHQYLHYIGIPLSVNYAFVERNGFSLYGALGGSIEKCVSAMRKSVFYKNGEEKNEVSEHFSVNDFDFSVSAKVGVSYAFAKHLGIFVEPSLNYYFMNSDKPGSYRKDSPLGVSFRAGLFASF